MTDRRTLPVPDGLEGLRLDAALSRLFGLSRTAAAEIIAGGSATLDGKPSIKSDRVSAGNMNHELYRILPFLEMITRSAEGGLS